MLEIGLIWTEISKSSCGHVLETQQIYCDCVVANFCDLFPNVCRFDSTLSDVLEPQHTLSDTRMDSRIQSV